MKFRKSARAKSGAVLVTMAFVAIGLVSTSLSAAASKAPTRATGHAALINVPIVLGSNAAVENGDIYYGVNSGIFRKLGLNVEVNVYTSASLLPAYLETGQDLMAFSGSTGAYTLATQGIQTSTVYAHLGNGDADFVVAPPSVTSVKQCTTVATQPIGQPGYAWALFIEKQLKISYNIEQISAPALMVAAVESGSANCALLSYSSFSGAIVAGLMHVIWDSSIAHKMFQGKWPSVSPEASAWGLTTNLKANRSAVTRFVAGILEVNKVWHSGKVTPGQIISVLQSGVDNAGYAPQVAATLVNSYLIDKGFFSPHNGFINPSVWKTSVNFWAAANVPGVTVGNPTLSYKHAVDMSYYNAAVKLDAKVFPRLWLATH